MGADRSRGGRPPHEPTPESRERVQILLGGGMTHDQIAAAIGISAPTLRQHYGEELSTGRAKKRAEMLEAMFRAGIGGNVSAQKAYIAQHSELDDPKPEKDEPIGKKAAAQAAAREAGQGTDWASLLPH